MNKNFENINSLAAHFFRYNSGKMVAVLCSKYSLSQVDAILDIVHDTFEAALVRWKFSGIPNNPEGWLMQVAKNKAINYFKKDSRQSPIDPFLLSSSKILENEPQQSQLFLESEIEDEQLKLLFTCCHLPLTDTNKIMLTLNVLCGFGRPEIARALLLKRETVKKALFRSRKLLKEHNQIFDYKFPLKEQQYVGLLHTVLYLMFNEGYKSTKSPLIINHELGFEAMRLTKLLLSGGIALKYRTYALLALMFFSLSRFPARISAECEFVTLVEQDRNMWDKKYITEGHYYLAEATKGGDLSSYHLEAIIASIHCSTMHFDKTDWKKIAFLYEQLIKINPSPMVVLNAIVAKSYVYGCDFALQEMGQLKPGTGAPGYHYWMVIADLYKRSRMPDKATKAYTSAWELATNLPDQQFLEKKLMSCQG